MWFKRQNEKFQLIDWDGKKHYLTAEELFNRVQSDSKSDYDWIASATQLYSTTHLPGFDKRYADGIMLIVLNCFANLELRKTEPSRSEDTAHETINKIYNELLSDDETAKKIKEKYLKNVIHRVTIYDPITDVRIFLPLGETFKKLSEDWEKSTFEKYSKSSSINLEQLFTTLMQEYEVFLYIAKRNESVIKENEKYRGVFYLI